MRRISTHLRLIALSLAASILIAALALIAGPRGLNAVKLTDPPSTTINIDQTRANAGEQTPGPLPGASNNPRDTTLQKPLPAPPNTSGEGNINTGVRCFGRAWPCGMAVFWHRAGYSARIGKDTLYEHTNYRQLAQRLAANRRTWSGASSLSDQGHRTAIASIEAVFGFPFHWLYLATDLEDPARSPKSWYVTWQNGLLQRPLESLSTLRVLWLRLFGSWLSFLLLFEAIAFASRLSLPATLVRPALPLSLLGPHLRRYASLALLFGLLLHISAGIIAFVRGPVYSPQLAADIEVIFRKPDQGIITASLKIFEWHGGQAILWTRESLAATAQPIPPQPTSPAQDAPDLSYRTRLILSYGAWGGPHSIGAMHHHHTPQSCEALFGWPVPWLYAAIPRLQTPPTLAANSPISPAAQWTYTANRNFTPILQQLTIEPVRFALGWGLWSVIALPIYPFFHLLRGRRSAPATPWAGPPTASPASRALNRPA